MTTEEEVNSVKILVQDGAGPEEEEEHVYRAAPAARAASVDNTETDTSRTEHT